MNKIVSHAFIGPYQACKECGLRREAAVHSAHRVAAFLGDRAKSTGKGTRNGVLATVPAAPGLDDHELEARDVRDVLDRQAKAELALEAVLGVQEQTGAGDYNRALADVRQAVIEALV